MWSPDCTGHATLMNADEMSGMDRQEKEAGTEEATVEDALPEDGAADVAGSVGEVERMQRELSSLNDRFLRMAAEYDNYRKRTERDRAEIYQRAQGEVVKRLLDALDDLERVADHAETSSTQSLVEGVQLVEKKLLNALAAAGLETVDAFDKPFDPTTMEALATVAAETEAEDEHVADVFQKGYRFGSTLLRPARVRVKKYED